VWNAQQEGQDETREKEEKKEPTEARLIKKRQHTFFSFSQSSKLHWR
jgi:hypothetical protein